MNPIIFFMMLSVSMLCVTANGQNPYQSLGKPIPKGKMLTLSDGKFQEFFPNDTLVPIGSVMYNTVTGQVVAFLTQDTLYAEYNLEPEVVSRWLSPDPLAAQYQSWSPYNYTLNNPILFIDPDGRSVDNTIVSNASGTKQITIIDDQPDAVAIYSDKEFDNRFLSYGNRNQYNTNIDKLRGDAMYLYMVDGMVKLENFALTQIVDYTSEWYLDKTGKRITNLYPEESAPFKSTTNGNQTIFEVDFENKWESMHSARLSRSSGGIYNHIHIHTNGFRPDIDQVKLSDGSSSSGVNFGGDPTAPPSSRDWSTAIDVYSNSAKFYNVVVSPHHLHLYNGGQNATRKLNHIIINRADLSKQNQKR